MKDAPIVLITRPESDAGRLRQALHEAGYPALVEPMLTVSTVPALFPDMPNIGSVIFTSARGAAHVPYAQLPSGWQSWPCYCVGARTADAAARHGWRHVITGDGDGARLAELIAERQKPEQGALLHAGGEALTADPDAALRRAGYAIVDWTVYRTESAAGFSPACAAALGDSLRAVLFFSARSAQVFARLARQDDLAACCGRLIALCLSDAVADAAAELSWLRIVAAAAPNEPALLDALRASIDEWSLHGRC